MRPFRWGVLGTGSVARKFILGIRGSSAGTIDAVASRTATRAAGFAGGLGVARSYGSYEELLGDSAIDAVYIATTPETHGRLAVESLRHRKPTLVEKPFARTSAEAQEIASVAREMKVFCMEAMWTRFIPAVVRMKELVASGSIGEICTMAASFGIPEQDSGDHPLFRAELGGGALLDRGVYLISLAVAVLGTPASVSGRMVVASGEAGKPGVDTDSTLILNYKNGAVAVLHASLKASLANDVQISGTKGEIHLESPVYRPSRVLLRTGSPRAFHRSGEATGLKAKIMESSFVHQLRQRLEAGMFGRRGSGSRNLVPYSGNGYQHEAIEVRRCVESGMLESPQMPLSESQSVLLIADQFQASAHRCEFADKTRETV